MKRFPADAPQLTDSAAYRMAGNAVPVPYFTSLLNAVVEYLHAADVSPATPKAQEYCMSLSTNAARPSLRERMASPIATQANRLASAAQSTPVVGSTTISLTEKIKTGNHLVHDLKRDELGDVALHPAEIANMSVELDRVNYGRLEDSSLAKVKSYVDHWKSFCLRFGLPILLNTDTLGDIKAAAAQGQLFALYELGNFKQKADHVNKKLWAVDKFHEVNNLNPPFAENRVLRTFISNAIAKDKPSLPTVPIAQKQMDALKEELNLDDRPAFTFWTGRRYAICFLCRISEWAKGGKHSVTWKCITFLDAEGNLMDVTSLSQLHLIKEMEVVFWTDKTHSAGHGVIHNWFAIENREDDKCLVRDMARLWIMSERISELEVFTWDNGTKGVTRAQVNTLLKKAAVKAGIPASDTASHSARITGLSQLFGLGNVPFEIAREWGRWKSDCARRYWWAAANVAELV